MSQITIPLTNKRIKVFFVEEDDDDRERVLWGILEGVRISQEDDFGSVEIDDLLDSARIYQRVVRYKLEEAYFVPREDGTVLTMEDWSDRLDDDEE